MPFKILGEALDTRTGTRVIYAQSDIPSYLSTVGVNFDEFDIQRRRVKHKAYGRMKEDIIAGALLPPITLAVKKEFCERISEITDPNILSQELSIPNRVNILDGLQRTHILNDIVTEGFSFKDKQTLLLEIWIEQEVSNLIYRIIILNAGQKPMSMRHQIELLFSSTKDLLQRKITDLDILSERDGARRTRAKKYPFSTLSLSYYAYITKSPEVDKDNLIAQKLQEDEILSGGEKRFNDAFERYSNLLEKFTQIDKVITEIYPEDGLSWIGSENVMLSFFAAAASFDTRVDGIHRVDSAIESLVSTLTTADPNSDPMALEDHKMVINGFNARRVNIGFATRKLLFNAFREYFRADGEIQFRDLWLQEAD